MTRDYPETYEGFLSRLEHLTSWIPGVMTPLARARTNLVWNSKLPRQFKELIALALAVCTHSDACIAYHVRQALKAGATRRDVLGTLEVAVIMGGEPSIEYACHALEALDQFSPETVPDFPRQRIVARTTRLRPDAIKERGHAA